MFSCLFKDDIDFILIIVNHYKTYYFEERVRERKRRRERERMYNALNKERVRVCFNCQTLPRTKTCSIITNLKLRYYMMSGGILIQNRILRFSLIYLFQESNCWFWIWFDREIDTADRTWRFLSSARYSWITVKVPGFYHIVRRIYSLVKYMI